MLLFDKVALRQGGFKLQADAALPKDAIIGLIGPSGAGKSTVLAAIAGFLTPSAGSIIWDGTTLDSLAPGQRPVSMLFQDNNLFPHLSAAQNVGLGLQPNLKLSSDQAVQVEQSLADVGLAGLGDRLPSALSGGQQSRVALARVLVADRPLVLLDEPFAALGPALKDEMLDLVQSKLMAASKTVIMVTHDPADARRIADYAVLVADGVLAQPVPTEVLLGNPPPSLAAYLGT